MNKIISIIGAVLIVFAGVYFVFYSDSKPEELQEGASNEKNATYKINGEEVTLKDGLSEKEAASGSASKIVTRYFGNEVKIDLDGDGREDTALLLTQETGGSGTFFYVVAALNTEEGYIGSEGLLLGDRIAPQTTEISQNPNHKGVIVVNYADRAPGEPMTASPSVGKSVWLKLDPETMQFGEVAQNFEGEADPSRMNLEMKEWVWVRALYNDGRKIEPKQADKFKLKFNSNGTFSASTDCNGVGGKYTKSGNKISFSEMVSTLMYCEGSQESEFRTLLDNTDGYHFTSRGELILDLKFDSGTVTFR